VVAETYHSGIFYCLGSLNTQIFRNFELNLKNLKNPLKNIKNLLIYGWLIARQLKFCMLVSFQLSYSDYINFEFHERNLIISRKLTSICRFPAVIWIRNLWKLLHVYSVYFKTFQVGKACHFFVAFFDYFKVFYKLILNAKVRCQFVQNSNVCHALGNSLPWKIKMASVYNFSPYVFHHHHKEKKSTCSSMSSPTFTSKTQPPYSNVKEQSCSDKTRRSFSIIHRDTFFHIRIKIEDFSFQTPRTSPSVRFSIINSNKLSNLKAKDNYCYFFGQKFMSFSQARSKKLYHLAAFPFPFFSPIFAANFQQHK